MKCKIILIIGIGLFFSACNEQHVNNLDGEKLIKEKCSSCHNLDLPPKSFKNEKAPPMMAVAFHIKGFIKTNDESAKIPKAIDFVKDYVINPSASKSFCDKKSLQSYGVMPSQKGKVTEDELGAIARYMFEHFTQDNLNKAQLLQNRLNSMPKGQKLALKNNCLACHKTDKDLVGPSFTHIAKKYSNTPQIISKSIKNGSKEKWEKSHGAIMPKFDKLSDEDIKTLTNWIKNYK